ncbi:uncharacterized protein LOC110901424 [Helianthus annuus]|uniref:uncharacterized protein LOC110901424 n=1 Tax=Helianthus annuus TaxID=4232 RepID=UPI00165326BC|nr:uncharacterized protein LOC110901424 [Helianthus annuus]
MFIDPGSSMDIIYEQCFKQLDPDDKARLEPVDFPLTGFCNEAVFPLGQIAFPVTLSDGEHSQTVTVNFMVMPATSRHDVLLGRRSQREFSMITSIPHAACGFPTETGVAILYSSKEVMYVDDEPPAKVVKPSASNEPEKWVLNEEYPEQTISLGHAISPVTRIQLKALLSNNKDIFACTLRNCGKKTPFQWTPEAEAAFKQMKECLIQLPTLTAPKEKEPLILYLSAAEVAVGAVLMVERDNVQTPIYYISKMLTGPETRYSMIEKLVLALVHASRCLRRYFSGHVVTVLTNYHLGQILSKPDVVGRLAKWAIELGGYNIFYKPRPAIKGQVLADFATEVSIDKVQECEAIQNPTPVFDDRVWTLHTDGASNDDGAGASLRLVSPDNHELTYAIRLDFQSTNNEAEYEAFLAGLRLALKMGARNLEANVDSKLVAEQVNGHYDAKGEAMALYLEQARMLISQFQTFRVNHINRSENKHADALSKLAATSFKHLAKEVRIEVLSNPSIHLKQVNVIEVGNPSWMSSIILYLQHGKLPEGKAEARKLQHKAINYEMADGVLYRKSFMGPLLRCVDKTDAQYLVREIHEGLCGIHAGPRIVVAKIMNAGYYWPGMHMDAVDLLRRCTACQRHAPKILRPKNPLVPVTSAWPFQQWGIDLVGPFPDAPGAVKFIIVAVDYFTKWVEAKALASTTAMVVDGIKARLGTARRGWVNELSSILQAYRTMPKTSTGETPFSLVYGSEAVIPAEIGLPSPRMIAMEKQNNEQERRLDLDLLEERRENAAITEARYKSKLEKYYNARVRVCTFVPGDFVLRDNEASNAEIPGKLAPRWEGPYVINEVLGKGAYTLKRIDGTLVPRTWNAQQLRRCYM